MNADPPFTILSKEVQLADAVPVAPHHPASIRIQREGSVAVPYGGVIGQRDFSEGVEGVLLQMRQGERWTVADSEGAKYEIEVVEVGAIVDGRTHLERAEVLKGEGNTHIKAKDNAKAIDKYQQAYNLVLNDPTPPAQELKLSLISNLALATLNTADYRAAIAWCTEHLQETLDPNLKVLYRRASANKGLRNWAQARSDIQSGVAHSAGDEQSAGNFRKLLVQLQREYKQQKEREKAVYGKMFG